MTFIRNFPYTDIDGDHWPDTPKGSELVYSVEFGQWLFTENDAKVSVSWMVPEGLTETLITEDDYTGYIRLRADNYGSHKVVCTLTTKENGIEQSKVIPIMLKVY